MYVEFSGDEFLETAPKFRKRKKTSSSCVYVLHKTYHQEISRPSRSVTAKKCIKRYNAGKDLLFWLQNLLLFLRSRCRRRRVAKTPYWSCDACFQRKSHLAPADEGLSPKRLEFLQIFGTSPPFKQLLLL